MNLLVMVRKIVIEIGSKGAIGEMFYYRVKYSAAKIITLILGEKGYAKWFYHLYTGKTLSLDDPKTFDEKLWWLKLNYRNPLLTKCSDKNAVRDYVKRCGFEDILIPQLDVLSSVKELNFEKYQKEVVAKCNHNSGGLIFYNKMDQIKKKELDIQKKKLSFILKQNASVLSKEWNYKNIRPCIVVEEVIRDKKGKLPLDYKIMCFNGEPKMLFLDLGVINSDGSYNHDYPRNIYDMNFNLLPVFETRPNADFKILKPKNWERMVEIARKLSKPFPHCRVDLYNVDGNIYFGEITFYHGGGCNNIQPEEWGKKMGDWIDISSLIKQS